MLLKEVVGMISDLTILLAQSLNMKEPVELLLLLSP